MVNYYCTLAQVKAELRAENAVSDNYVLGLIQVVSQRVDELLKRRYPYFLPYSEDIPLNVDTHSARMNTLLLPNYLLSLTSVVVNTTDVTAYTRLYPPNQLPVYRLQLDNTVKWTYYPDVDYPITFVTVTGVWGYNRDYTHAWQAVDAITTVGGINASVTTFTVADADGVDSYGLTPRLSIGNYIKVDNEFMLVTGVNTTTNTLTVKRGVLGTTPATHDAGATVSTYTIEPIVSQTVARQVGKIYANRGGYTGQTTDVGTFSYPPDLLAELKNVISLYLGM